MLNSIPQHPGRQQQGLGAPTGQEQQPRVQTPSGREFYTPSAAMSQYNEGVTGEAALKLARERQSGAQEGKVEAETNLLKGLGAMGQQIQAKEQQAKALQQVTEGVITGQLNEESLGQLVQSGRITPELAQAAVQQAHQYSMQQQQDQRGLV